MQLTAPQNGANPNAPGEGQQIASGPAQLGAGGGVGGVGGEGLGGAVTDQATLAALQNPTTTARRRASSSSIRTTRPCCPAACSRRSSSGRGPRRRRRHPDSALDDERLLLVDRHVRARRPSSTQTGGRFIRIRSRRTCGRWRPTRRAASRRTTRRTSSPWASSSPRAARATAPSPRRGPSRPRARRHRLLQLVRHAARQELARQGLQRRRVRRGGARDQARARRRRWSSRGPPSPPASGTGCRVCHVVSSDGSTLIAQHGDTYAETSAYDLKNGNAENALTAYDNVFGWAGLSADGTLALTNAGDLAASDSVSQLYAFPPAASGATPIAAAGIPTNLKAGTPAFSPDTKHVAFDFLVRHARRARRQRHAARRARLRPAVEHLLEPARPGHDDRRPARRLPVVLPDGRRRRLPLPARQLEPSRSTRGTAPRRRSGGRTWRRARRRTSTPSTA